MLHLILSSLYVFESKSLQTPKPIKYANCSTFMKFYTVQILSNGSKQLLVTFMCQLISLQEEVPLDQADMVPSEFINLPFPLLSLPRGYFCTSVIS
jgi:hypothetical protein